MGKNATEMGKTSEEMEEYWEEIGKIRKNWKEKEN